MAKVDGRQEILKAVLAAGLRWDQRAKNAYKVPGVDTWRIDLSGARTARLESKHGTWSGYSDPLYYGQVKSPEYARQWVEWAAATMRAGRAAGPEPKPVMTESDVKKRESQQARQALTKETKHGRGFYVVNVNANAGAFSTKKLVANFGPLTSRDEAIDKAWDLFRQYVEMQFGYLLPVKVVEARSRDEAEQGNGYVWWVDGKRKAAPVDPRQTQMFANYRRRHTGAKLPADLWVVVGSYTDKSRVVYGPEPKSKVTLALTWFRKYYPRVNPFIRRATLEEVHGKSA
jgi:hypothetical protein